MRTCVIFNPAAKGSKARNFRQHLDELAGQSAFKATGAPGDARRLAAAAVAEGYDIVAAAGGDGTVHEVLNGLGDADAFDRVRFGVLPLGTVNVFARELQIPMKLAGAWDILRRGRETQIDLPQAEYFDKGVRKRNYFVQLGGAGLDSRAIELVDWEYKKRVGPMAYVIAGLRALREKKAKIIVRAEDKTFEGELVLVGNGRLYGGPFAAFPAADLRDGRLDICIFPRVNFGTLLRCGPAMLLRRRLPEPLVRRLQARSFELTGESGFELDGEWIGKLPATFSIASKRLRVIVP